MFRPPYTFRHSLEPSTVPGKRFFPDFFGFPDSSPDSPVIPRKTLGIFFQKRSSRHGGRLQCVRRRGIQEIPKFEYGTPGSSVHGQNLYGTWRTRGFYWSAQYRHRSFVVSPHSAQTRGAIRQAYGMNLAQLTRLS